MSHGSKCWSNEQGHVTEKQNMDMKKVVSSNKGEMPMSIMLYMHGRPLEKFWPTYTSIQLGVMF